LIAQLATARRVRAPLAHVANQVFLDLAEELNRQGVSRKVSADMFGLALRTYLRKIQRLSEGATEQGRSIWQAVLEKLESQPMTRAELYRHFRHDDSEVVAGVLHDLTESGLVFRAGTGPGTTYRAASQEELGKMSQASEGTGLDELVWALIYREGPLTQVDLERLTRGTQLDEVLERLLAAGHVQRKDDGDEVAFQAKQLSISKHAPAGWEAAVFDHFQAMVKTVAARVNDSDANDGEHVGGSTYSFEVWKGHPHEKEALAQLKHFREKTSELRARIRHYNQDHERGSEVTRVTVYGGQCVVTLRGDDHDDV
jgi:hypothetical protein